MNVYPRVLGQALTPEPRRISVGLDGSAGNAPSQSPAMSADGRWIAFASSATNLAAEDRSASRDIFVHDRETGATVLATRGNKESTCPDISGDGRMLAFHSWADNLVSEAIVESTGNIYVRDMQSGALTLASRGHDGGAANETSLQPTLANGLVVFKSWATNLTPHGHPKQANIFAHDWKARRTWLVSGAPNGQPANGAALSASVSADGRWVAFASDASNLVEGDTNGACDVFMHDLHSGTTRRLSTDADGAACGPAISGDGAWVAYNARVPGQPQRIVLQEVASGQTTPVPAPPDVEGDCWSASLSGDGRYLCFAGSGGGRANVYVFDRQSGDTTQVSTDTSGTTTDQGCADPRISLDGATVAFATAASNLAPRPTDSQQVYVARNFVSEAVQNQHWDDVLARADERRQAAEGGVSRHEDYVVLNGIKIPRAR